MPIISVFNSYFASYSTTLQTVYAKCLNVLTFDQCPEAVSHLWRQINWLALAI